MALAYRVEPSISAQLQQIAPTLRDNRVEPPVEQMPRTFVTQVHALG
jgi:hypothetical protein